MALLRLFELAMFELALGAVPNQHPSQGQNKVK